jgi:hypothetical protein
MYRVFSAMILETPFVERWITEARIAKGKSMTPQTEVPTADFPYFVTLQPRASDPDSMPKGKL